MQERLRSTSSTKASAEPLRIALFVEEDGQYLSLAMTVEPFRGRDGIARERETETVRSAVG